MKVSDLSSKNRSSELCEKEGCYDSYAHTCRISLVYLWGGGQGKREGEMRGGMGETRDGRGRRGAGGGRGEEKGSEGKRGKYCAREACASSEERRETRGWRGRKGAGGGEAYPLPIPSFITFIICLVLLFSFDFVLMDLKKCFWKSIFHRFEEKNGSSQMSYICQQNKLIQILKENKMISEENYFNSAECYFVIFAHVVELIFRSATVKFQFILRHQWQVNGTNEKWMWLMYNYFVHIMHASPKYWYLYKGLEWVYIKQRCVGRYLV